MSTILLPSATGNALAGGFFSSNSATRATELLEAGLRIENVQCYLGHTSIKSTHVCLMDVRMPSAKEQCTER